jgi:drug/metabolite transporter (DMT)-like permease
MTTQLLPKPTAAFPRLPLLALFLGASAIGFAPIFMRLSESGPISTAFWRLALAAPVLWLGVWLSRQQSSAPARPLSRTDQKLLIGAGFFFAADLFVWHLSLEYTSVANATLLPNMAPVFVTLGAWLIFRQRITRTFLLGMALAMMGAALLIGQSLNVSNDQLLGDMLALGTAVFYAGYILSTKHLRERVAALTVMAWSSTVCGLLLLPAALLMGEQFVPLTAVGWLVLLGLAWVSHVSGQGMIVFSLAALPATFSSVSLLWQPVMAAMLAWLLLDETLVPLQLLGGVIVLAGIFIARRGSQVG